jgi:hypothetical protein
LQWELFSYLPAVIIKYLLSIIDVVARMQKIEGPLVAT